MVKSLDFIKQVLKGKSVYRILFNWQVQENCAGLTGEVLDLAAGAGASYQRYLPGGLKVLKTDFYADNKPDKIVDFNQPLPFEDEAIENVFLFNALNIARKPEALLAEIYRILKPGGQLFLSSLFMANEMAEPKDYWRHGYDGLLKELQEAGFQEIKIHRIGERFSAAAHLLHPLWGFDFVRLFVFALALLLDRLIPKKLKKRYPCPIGYFCVVRK